MRKLTAQDVIAIKAASNEFSGLHGYVLASNNESSIIIDSDNNLFKVHEEQNEIESVVKVTGSVIEDIECGAYTAE